MSNLVTFPSKFDLEHGETRLLIWNGHLAINSWDGNFSYITAQQAMNLLRNFSIVDIQEFFDFYEEHKNGKI